METNHNRLGIGDQGVSDPRVCNWLAVPASVVQHYRQPRHMRAGTPVEGRGWLAWTALPAAGRRLILLMAFLSQVPHLVDGILRAGAPAERLFETVPFQWGTERLA